MRLPTVIIIAHPEDVHAGTVAYEVDRLGHFRILILDAADFPQRWSIAFNLASTSEPSFRVCAGGEEIDDDALAGVWYRRITRHHVDSPLQSARVFGRAEARSLFESWLYALGDRVINPRISETFATHKTIQLRAALRVGLRVPDTLATNDWNLAKDFACRGTETIFKTFTAIRIPPIMLPTQELTPDLIPELSRLSLAPVIFQERIRSEFDVRATIVDHEVFAVQICSDNRSTNLDWRLDGERNIRPYTLPSSVSQKLVHLARELGLRFGACDLAVTSGGEHVFYEINPGGQFLFAEIHGGVPISAAIARALTRRPSRVG